MEYNHEEWIGDLILELHQEQIENGRDPGVRWDHIRSYMDALGWSLDEVEEMLSTWMDKGLMYEPRMGSLAPVSGMFPLHRIDQRKAFMRHAKKEKALREEKEKTSSFSIRILDVPGDLADKIVGLLQDNRLQYALQEVRQ